MWGWSEGRYTAGNVVLFILVTAIVHPEFSGLRVTPQVYTTPAEIDRFCAAMEHVLAEGLPA